MMISGRTSVTGIIGWPVDHSLSPIMHNAAYDALSLDYCYVPFPVRPENLADAANAIRALSIKGINVTIPHKERILAYLDEIDTDATRIGAVNTIVNREGRLVGFNTDGKGFLQSLGERDIDPSGKDILIIGAGGAARAVGFALVVAANSVSFTGRTRERVDRLVSDLRNLKSAVFTHDETRDLSSYQIIINATPLGLRPDDPLPLDPSALSAGQIVCDLIYRRTRLIEEAAERGCVVLDGLGMLLWQGVFAFELWTGVKPDPDVMRRALARAISQS